MRGALVRRLRALRPGRCAGLLVTLLLLLAPVLAYAERPATPAGDVVRVSVEGTRRIEQATVLAAIGLRSGQVVPPERVRRDLKSVYATGFFDDIRVEMVDEGGGVALIFTVVEKPAVRDVVIS
ncbi:MAG: hypothetical protein JRJ84_24355, partial [Deltaproteobacteria bacterium]|nr:hypothetical protein [Deltaproteobacteria bacterium]